MVGHAGSATGIVHADMTLTQSKVKIMRLLNFRKLARPCMLEAMTVSPLAGLSGSNIIALRPVLCFVMAAVWNTIIFCPVVSFFVLSSFFSSPNLSWSQIGCLPYFYTWCRPSANLECRSEMCWARLAGNAWPKTSPSGHHRTTLSGYIFATKAFWRYTK